MRTKKTVWVLSVLAGLYVLILTLINFSQRQNLQKNAAEPKKETAKNEVEVRGLPKYANNQLIVKLRKPIKSLRNLKGTVFTPNWNQGKVKVSEIDPTSLPVALQLLNTKTPIDLIEKVFNNEVLRRLEDQGRLESIYKINLKYSTEIRPQLTELSAQPEVEFVQPNYQYQTQFEPNDPYYLDSYPNHVSDRDKNWNPPFDYQWNLKKISMNKAWDYPIVDSKIKVAVIDTGVDYTHSELGGCTLGQVLKNKCTKVVAGYDFVNNDNDPIDDHGHGTHVSGTILAGTNNGQGVASVNLSARILPIKALNSYGIGYSDKLANAIYFAANNNVRVINMSWGGYGSDQLIHDALDYASHRNIVLVAAAGNNNDNVSFYFPANDPAVIAVAASNEVDQRAGFSNFGSLIAVSAPGTDIISLRARGTDMYLGAPGYVPGSRIIGSNYYRASGTSMAAPHVSALALLVLNKDRGPDSQRRYLSNVAVKNIIINGAQDLGEPGFDDYFGYGRIDAAKTLAKMDASVPPLARITFPSRIRIGRSFKIDGSVRHNAFLSYSIEYASYQTPQEWSTSGIELVNSGATPVVDGLLASANLDPTLTDGDYYLRLTVRDNFGNTHTTTTSFILDQKVRSGFPLLYNTPAFNEIRYLVTDVDQDQNQEMVISRTWRSQVYLVSNQGVTWPNWPQSADVPGLPLALDLDSSAPGLEIIIPGGGGNLSCGRLYGFYGNGSMVPGWTDQDWQTRGLLNYLLDSAAANRIQGLPLVFYPETWKCNSTKPTKLHLFTSSGEEAGGWPVTINYETAVNVDSIFTDLNQDNQGELITTFFNNIRIYNQSGSLAKTIAVPDLLRNMVSADIDNDGFGEIIVLTEAAQGRPRIYVWDHLGNLKNNWPYTLPRGSAHLIRFLTVGDFNNDQQKEMFTAVDNEYFLVDSNANLIMRTTGSMPEPKQAVNVSLADNKHLIAAVSDWGGNLYLHEYNPDTNLLTPVAGFPKYYSHESPFNGWAHQPTLTDLDGDNDVDLLVNYQSGTMNYLYAFDLGRVAGDYDWPQYLNNEKRTNAILAE